MPSKDQRHPNWAFADGLLAEVIPGSTSFDLDDIKGLTPEIWAEFPVDGLDPADVNRSLVTYCNGLISGQIVIATEASYASGAGPFFTTADSLGQFIKQYVDYFDDAFVASDVLILCPSEGIAVAVHHNGSITTLQGTKASNAS